MGTWRSQPAIRPETTICGGIQALPGAERKRNVNSVADRSDSNLTQRPPGALVEPDELPVVARLVVEIRSDGTRTIARGALEDRVSGAQVGIKAEGASPAALAASLMRSLVQLPAFAPVAAGRETLRKAARRLLGAKKRE